MGAAGSVSGAAAWMRPPITVSASGFSWVIVSDRFDYSELSLGFVGAPMATNLSVSFTGIRFENPFLLASAPPTESESNILRAFEAGWGGVVTKTIGMHPVVNVAGPKTKFLRATPESGVPLDEQAAAATSLHSSWNWELISDKPLDWWMPRIERIKKAFPAAS